MNQAALNKIQSITTIISAIAIPIVIAVIGYFVQTSIASESAKKDYVQMAVSILNNKDIQDKELRQWAVNVIDKNSPTPLSSNILAKLEDGTIFVAIPCPKLKIPEELLKKAEQLRPLQNIAK